jgi:transcriptional/translational regulatory protein YebC/TACO1
LPHNSLKSGDVSDQIAAFKIHLGVSYSTTGRQVTATLRLVEALEELDDVQHVYANFDIDESEIQAAVSAN